MQFLNYCALLTFLNQAFHSFAAYQVERLGLVTYSVVNGTDLLLYKWKCFHF